jgi:hypothetical protein
MWSGLDGRGAIVLRQKWSRGQIEARLANMPHCLIGMEACVGAHHQVQRRDNNLRLGLHLVNGETGIAVWADRLTRSFENVFDLMDEVIAKVAATILGRDAIELVLSREMSDLCHKRRYGTATMPANLAPRRCVQTTSTTRTSVFARMRRPIAKIADVAGACNQA